VVGAAEVVDQYVEAAEACDGLVDLGLDAPSSWSRREEGGPLSVAESVERLVALLLAAPGEHDAGPLAQERLGDPEADALCAGRDERDLPGQLHRSSSTWGVGCGQSVAGRSRSGSKVDDGSAGAG